MMILSGAPISSITLAVAFVSVKFAIAFIIVASLMIVSNMFILQVAVAK
jgi:hypothetical protein